MVLFFGMFSSGPENHFSMHMTDKHKYGQKTFNLNIPYFVSSSYFNLGPREKQNIQYQIEKEFVQNLLTKCEIE